MSKSCWPLNESHAQKAQLTGGLSDSACRATTSISARPLAPANVAPATQRHSSRYALSTYADQCCNSSRGSTANSTPLVQTLKAVGSNRTCNRSDMLRAGGGIGVSSRTEFCHEERGAQPPPILVAHLEVQAVGEIAQSAL